MHVLTADPVSVLAGPVGETIDGPLLRPEATVALIQRALQAVRDHFGMEVAFVSRFDGGNMEFRHVAGDASVFAFRQGEVVELGRQLCQEIVRTGDAVAFADVTDSGAGGQPGGGGPRAYLGAPVLREDGSIFGSLCALSTAARPGSELRDAGILKALADVVSHALEQEDRWLTGRRRDLAAVRQVLAQDLVEPVFQPIRHLVTGHVLGFEALARFPDGAAPDTWFARAHEAGLGLDLEFLAVRRALSSIDRLPPACYLSVNVSPQAAASEELGRLLEGAPTERLVLELTEHTAVGDYGVLADAVRLLQRRGCRVAVDDVGAGYASFRHVMELSPDIVKIDRSLVAGLHHHRIRRAFLAGLVATAAEIDVTIVAEGVESDEELQTLVEVGLRCGQGFHLGRPGPMA